jgi:hypothetical protein
MWYSPLLLHALLCRGFSCRGRFRTNARLEPPVVLSSLSPVALHRGRFRDPPGGSRGGYSSSTCAYAPLVFCAVPAEGGSLRGSPLSTHQHVHMLPLYSVSRTHRHFLMFCSVLCCLAQGPLQGPAWRQPRTCAYAPFVFCAVPAEGGSPRNSPLSTHQHVHMLPLYSVSYTHRHFFMFCSVVSVLCPLSQGPLQGPARWQPRRLLQQQQQQQGRPRGPQQQL